MRDRSDEVLPLVLRELREGRMGNKDHMELLYWIPLLLRAKVAVEIGTGTGFSASLIAAALQVNGGTLYSTDASAEVRPQEHLGKLGIRNVELHTANGVKFLSEFGKEIDFAFEDSSHTFEDTVSHLEGIHNRLRAGGVVMIHDADAVRGATEEFLRRHSEYLYHHDSEGVGMDILQKGPVLRETFDGVLKTAYQLQVGLV